MGKLSLYLVLGFGILYMIMGNKSNKISILTNENMVDYNAKTMVHSIAVSATNLACNEIFLNGAWDEGFVNVPFNGGYVNANVQVLDPFRNIRKLTTSGNYGGLNKTIEVIFQPSNFSKFAYLSISDPTNLYWSNNDTIWGPFHSQGNINAYRHPVFKGKVTTKGYVNFYENEILDAPRFCGGFESGVSLTFPAASLDILKSLANSNGHLFSGKDTVYLTFRMDSINFKYEYSANETSVLASYFAPNGVIFADNSVILLKGTVKGQYTIGCSGTLPKGNIYLDDNITYNTDPTVDPESKDLLGIVSKNNVLITNNEANQSSIDIHASIYCEQGGFGAGWQEFTEPNGNINLLGGIQNYCQVQIGIIQGTQILGFNKRYNYDERLMIDSPPGYPSTGQLEIVSWCE